MKELDSANLNQKRDSPELYVAQSFAAEAYEFAKHGSAFSSAAIIEDERIRNAAAQTTVDIPQAKASLSSIAATDEGMKHVAASSNLLPNEKYGTWGLIEGAIELVGVITLCRMGYKHVPKLFVKAKPVWPEVPTIVEFPIAGTAARSHRVMKTHIRTFENVGPLNSMQ